MNLKFSYWGFRRVPFYLLLILSFASLHVNAQNCTLNAGVAENLCPGVPMVLKGKFTGLFLGATPPVWSQVSGPAVTIGTQVVNGTDITANVTGYAPGNTYVFRITARCSDGTVAKQDVTFTTFLATVAKAGPNITSCAGNITMAGNATLYPGETSDWSIFTRPYGMVFTNSELPNATLYLPDDTSSVVSVRYTIVNPNGCVSASSISVTNNSGELPVTAGGNIVLSNCYTLTAGTNLFASYGGNGLNGQEGTWSFISGPNTPSFSNIHSNRSNITNLVQGVYRIRWTVAGPCVNGMSEITITVPAPTQSVTSGAGNVQFIYCDARTSTVLTGPTPQFTNEVSSWSVLSGAGVVTAISSPSTTITGLTPPASSTFGYSIRNTVTGCTSFSSYNIVYAPMTSIAPTGPNPIILPSTATAVSMPYTSTGGNQTYWQLVSGPIGTIIAPSGSTTYQFIDESPIDLTGLDKLGTYNFRLLRTTANAGQGGCYNAYADLSVVISLPPTAANAGTTGGLACNVFTSTLAGNIPFVGTGYWSQVDGPNTAVIADIHDPASGISGLINGGYVFRWIVSGGQGATDAQSDVLVKVSAAIPTIANAGLNRLVCNQTPITLQGNPYILNETGIWTVIPSSGVMFVDETDPHTKVTGLANNTSYSFTWTISNACNSTFSTVNITTSSTAGPKQAVAGAAQCLSSSVSTFNLAGNAPTGTETGTWSVISGPNTPSITSPGSGTTTVTGAINGTYKFEWSLETPTCAAIKDTVTITASAAATTATVTATPVNLCGFNTITLAGNTPTIGTGKWTQVGGPGGAVITDPFSPASTVTNLISASYIFRWTISNGACSSNAADVKYNISTPPSTPTVVGPVSVCAATSTVLTGNVITAGTGLWKVVSGPNTPVFSNFANPTTTFSGLVTGTYELVWTASNGINCPISQSAPLTVVVTQNATAGVTSTGLCNATVVLLSGNNGSDGTWSFVSGSSTPTLDQNSHFSAIATDLINGIYTFRYTLPAVGACVATSATVSINITGSPSAAQAGFDQVLCGATFTPLSADVPAVGTGTWSILSQPNTSVAGFTDSHSATTNMTGMIPGVYLLQWNVANGNCGVNSDIVRITTSAVPTTAVAGVNQVTACSGSIILSANIATVGLGTWSQVTSMSATIDAPNTPSTAVLNTAPGLYTFMWTISSGSCQASTATVDITVTSTPPTPATAGPNQNLCGTLTVATLAGSVPVGAEAGLWTIKTKPLAANLVFSNTSSFNTEVAALVPGVYEFTWTVSNGSCTSASTVTITVTAPPTTANAGPDNSFCLYTPVALAATAVSTGVGTWSVTTRPVSTPEPVFGDINSNTTVVNGLLAGDYVFTWVTTNGIACATSMSSVTIHIVQPPTPAIAGNFQTVCLGVNPVMTANSPTFGTGTWAITTSAGGSPAFTNVNSFQTVVTGLVAGINTFSWTITNGGCTSSDFMQITVQPAVATNGIATAQTICSGGTPLALTGTNATGGDGTTYAYQWERSTTSALAGFSSITGAISTGFAPGTLTNTTWYRRLASSGTCSGVAANTSAVVEIIVLSPIAANTLTAPLTTTFCQSGDPDVIVGATPTGGDGIYVYQWQVSTVGAASGFTDVAAAIFIDYDPPVITTNTWYRRLVTSNACTATSTAVAFTVNPYAVLTSIAAPAAICSGATFSYSPTASIGGTTFAWTRATVAGINTGMTGSGVQSISETLTSTNTTIVPVQYLYSLTTLTGCTNPVAFSVTVNVKPRPNVDLPSDQVVCNGTLTGAINFTGSVVANTTYNWTNTIATIGIGANGTGNIAAFTATNALATQITAVIQVTPVSNSCSGTPQSFSLVINPTPNISAMLSTICTGTTFVLTPTNVTNGVIPAGTTFSWPAPTMSGTLTGGLAGSGMIALSGTLSHTNNTAQTATYIVTPNTAACGDGRPFTVTVSVLPTPLITDISTTVCASVTFTVTPTDPTNGRVPAGTTYTWNAPTGTGFTAGATQLSGGITSITGNLTNSVSTATTATYTVIPTTGACGGAPFSVIVSLNPKAILAPISITTCSAIPFAVTPVDVTNGILPAGTTFTWPLPTGTNLTGLTAQVSAVGGMFGALTNTNNTVVIATYRLAPLSAGCAGNMLAISVTVNPVASVTSMAAPTCSGVIFAVTPVNSTNGIVPSGTLYAWSAPSLSGTITGDAAATNSNSISGTLSISGTSAGTATYIVTPSTAACGNGNPFTVTISVNPVAIITPMSTVVCGGTPFTFTPTDVDNGVIPSGTTYSWAVPSGGGFSGALSGTNKGNITGNLLNTINTATTATYTITPRSPGSCNGTPFVITVSINPKPQLTPMVASICNGASFTVSPTNITNGIVPAGTTYSWPAPSGAGFTGGATATGSADILGTLANSFSSARTATYFVTPLSGSCTGNLVGVTVTVNPIAAVIDMTGTTCSGAFFSITPVDVTNGTIPLNTLYAWSVPTGTGFTGGTSQVTPLSSIRGTLTNTTNAAVTAVYTVSPSTNGCNGAAFTVTVTINPKPSVTPMPVTICSGLFFNITPVNSTNGIVPSGTTYSWSSPVGTGFTNGSAMTTQGGIFGTLINSNNTVVTATYVVTPTSGTCVGSTFAVTVTLNPIAAITAMTPVTCNGTIFTATPTNGTNGIVPAGTTYSWGLPSVTGTLTGGATGSVAGNITGTLSHTDNSAQTATYLVTPNTAACGNGVPFTVTVIVSPKAFMNNLTATICSGSSFAITPIDPNNGIVPAGTRYIWSAPVMTGVTGGVAQSPTSVTSITGTLTNTGTAPATATYMVTPVSGSCSGTSFAVTVTINPTPTLTSTVLPAPICNNATFIYTATSATAGTTFAWTRTTTTGITPAAPLTGTGDISQVLTSANVSRTNVPYAYALTANGCTNTQSFSITVNPSAVLSSTATPAAICNGVLFGYTPTTSATGVTVTYAWTRLPASGIISGGPSTGTTNISQTLTNSNTVPTPVEYIYTLTANGCTNPNQFTVTVMVNPTAAVDQPASPVIVCAGTLVSAITFTGSLVANTTYTWSNNNTSIALAAGGTGNIAAFTATNATAVPIVAVITVTPSSNTCNGTPRSFSITVNPTATVNIVADQVVCNGTNTTAVTFTGFVGSTVYSWTNTLPAIGLAGSGSGNIASFSPINAGVVPVTAFITVTPASNTCNGSARTFSITVNPTPTVDVVADQVVCNGTMTVASVFTGSPVAATVYGWSNTNATIGLAASGAGTINAFTGINAGIVPVTALITVRPMSNSCYGTATTFSVTVNPTPTVNAVASQAVCNGSNMATVTFSGAVTGTTYNWTNNNINIGVAASGAGNIASFSAINNTAVPVSALFTVTPASNTCNGTARTFSLTINPTPTVNVVADQVVCNGTMTVASVFTGSPVAATVYGWSNTNTTIGLVASGAGTINAFTGINAGIVPVTALITVTPMSNSCNGTARTFSITVNPTPTVNVVASQVVCNGSSMATVTFSGAVTNTTYNWTNNNINIGVAASGAGNIASFSAINNTAVPVSALFTVTPASNTCNGNARTFSLTISPTPTVIQVADQVVCNGTITSAVNFTGFVANTTYSWTNNTTSIGLAASGSGTINAFTATNITSSPVTALITVMPISNACSGSNMMFSITVNPTAGLTSTLSPTAICSNTTFSYTATSAVSGATFAWTRNGVSGIISGGPSTGTGNVNQTLTSSNNVQTNVGYVYTITANGCTNPLTFTVTVPVSAVALVNTVSATACAGIVFNIIPVNTTDGIVPAGTTYTWLAPIGSGFSGGALQGTGVSSISGTLINTTDIQTTAEYTVTPTSGACVGTPFTAVITLNPKAIVTPLTATICSGGTFNVTPAGGIIPAGTTYQWSVPTGANFTGGLSQASGVSSISGTLVNTSSSARTVTYLVTPMSGGSCSGNVFSVTVTVNAVASIGALTTITASGTTFEVSPVDGTNGIIVPAGTTYSWSSPTVTGGLTGGVGASNAVSISGTLINPTNSAQTATYSVTPLSGSCTGTAFTVTVRISPVASINPMTVTTCSGVFFVTTPVNAINGIVPAGTTYSWSAPSGAGFTGGASGSGLSSINGTLTNTTTAPVTATYIVTPSSGGNAGLPFSVTVTVNPSPVLNSIPSPAAICNNTVFSYTATTATAGSTLTWSRTTVAGITSGGAATGTDNISQTLANSTTSPLTEQYVYTISANGCINTSAGTVSVVVNPTPVLTSTLTPTAIYNATTFSYTATSATGGTTYTWTRAAITNINSNVTGSGSDGNINEVLVNTGVGLVNVPYVVVLTANGCTNAQTVTVGVSPTPVLSSTQTPSAICSGVVFAYTATSATPTTTFTWTRAAIATINGNAGGSGSNETVNETLTSSSNVPVSVVYTVILTANGFSNTQNVTVVVNPTPSVNQPVDVAFCNGVFVTPASFTGSVAGAIYNWTNNTTSIGVAASGSGTINAFTTTNSTTATVTAILIVTPVSNTCVGTARNFSITVYPTPVLSSTLTPSGICAGNPFSYTATSATGGTAFSWSRTTVVGITAGGPATGTGNVTGQTLSNSTTAPLNAGYVYTLTANSCANVQTVTVAVNPTPVLSSTLSPTAVFGGTPFVYTPTSATPATVFTWARATVIGISNTTGAGTGTVNEVFINTTAAPLNVVYVYTITAAGCANSESVTVSVIPSNIDAVDDNFSAACIDGGKGGKTASVLSNDILNSITVAPSLVNMSIVSNGGITGLTINALGELVIPAKTTEGTYTVTYNICVTANSTNCDQATATINVCRGLFITTTAVCINDVPHVHYKVETNFIPATGNPVTLKWLNGDKSVLTAQPVVSGTALEADVLWPGATVDSLGRPTDWPGWFIQNGLWVAGADGFEGTRPNAYLVVSVNPTDTVMLSYPPATPACAVNPVNRPPVAVNDRDSVGQCAPVTINVLGNDSDFEQGTLTVTLPSATTAHNGTAAVNTNGTVTYTPPSNYEGTDTFVYTITDAAGLTASATVTIIVASKPNIVGGISGICALPKDSTGVYSVASVANATGYLWTLPSGWTGSSMTNTINVRSGTANGVITVVPYNGGCFGTPVNYNVSIIDFAKVTLTASPSLVKGDNASTSEITIQLFDPNGNLIHCSGGIATLCTNSGTFTEVVDHGDGTYTAFLRSSANNAIICGSVGGVMVQQTITTTFSGPQGSIKGNGPIFDTETPLLTFNFTAGVGPYTVIYRPEGATKTDTLTNVVSNVAIPVKSISATKQYTMVSIIGSDNARRDNNFTRDTATIVVVSPRIIITLTADNPKFLADNLYGTTIRVKVRNNGNINLASVQVKANLTNVFPNPVQFILDSVRQHGIQTVPNNGYDGRQNFDLFSWNSTPGIRGSIYNNIASGPVPSMVYANDVNSSASFSDGENSDNYHIPFLPGHNDNAEKENTAAADNNGPMTTPFFFGALSKLDVGEESDMELFVRIIPNGYYKPFVMQAVAVGTGHTEFGTALANSLSNDNGNESEHPENTHDGDPLPTVINIFPNPVLGVAMSAGTPALQGDGTYNVTLNYVLKNYGNINLRSVGLLENLLRSIGSPATFNVIGVPTVTGNLVVNPAFNAKTDTNMLSPISMLGVDQTATVAFTINITPNQLSALYKLQATGTGFNSELGTTVTDLSTNGTNPDTDGNLIPEEKLITIIPINMSVPPLVPGTIGIQDPPSAATVLIKTFCTTTTVTVIPNVAPAGGLDPYTYQWQSSADNVIFTNIAGANGSTYTGSIAASTYLRRTVISGSQQAFSNVVRVVISNITKPVITASGSLNLTQSGSITLTSSAASSYLWTTNATTNNIVVTTAGGYRVTITDANGCTATSDLVAINPPPPTTVNRTYVIGAITNPPNSGIQVTGLTGATLTYYILTAGGTFIPVPVLPGVVGTTTYYVSQTVGGYESVRVPYTVTMIAPATLADLQKVTPKAAELQADGTYLVDFTIRATNLMATQLDSVKIRDDLRAVFPTSVQFAVVNVKTSGKLIANELYNGNTQIELLSDGSVIPASQKDSVVITVRVTPNGFSGQLVNTAIQFAKSPYGTFSVTSNDPAYGTGLAVREPTRFVIPVIDIFIPSGFSPNRDGVNDVFVITRPFNTSINLEIFNRWGNLVYRSRDYNNDWNGKGNQPNNVLGEDLPDGTYYYVVLATDKTTGTVRKFAAFITLKR